MNVWDNLQNGLHIDRVLSSLKTNPGVWHAVLVEYSKHINNAVWKDALADAWICSLNADWVSTRVSIWSASKACGFGELYTISSAAITTLISDSESEQYLNMESEKLATWSSLSDDRSAILLRPTVRAFELIDKIT